MHLRFGISSVLFAFFAAALQGQAPSPGSPGSAAVTVSPTAILQPVLSEVQSSTAALNISRWKAPGSVKQAAQGNVDSIQRDLGSTLPNLLAQADSAPAAVSPSFAVYRNVDALYDVLLRVSETADLAAPENEAASVAAAMGRLEAARSQLGDSILHNSQQNEAQIVTLAAAVRAAKTAPAEKQHATVVDDGPAKSPAKKTTKKTAPKKPAQKPEASTPSNGPSL